MAIKFDFESSRLNKGLGRLGGKVGAALLMYASTKAVEIEQTMKKNRPWTDRTGLAKTTLNAKVSQPNSHTIRITAAHGVDYGIWLELANNKNYAIVAPTIKTVAPKVMADMQGMFGGIKV